MTPEQEIQWREEFEEYFAVTKPYQFSILKDKKKTEFEISKLKFSIGYVSARKKAQEEIDSLKETKQEILEQRAYLIENNSFEERISEATHYTWLDDENERLEEEISQLKEEFEKLHSFCLNYQLYIHDILHSVNVFKSFHDLRKGAHAYAVSMDKDPKWDYQDTENTDYFNGLKSYVVQLKEQIASAKEIKQYPTALAYISELKEELKRERSAVDFCAKDLTYQSAALARQTQQQRRIEL